MTEEGFAPATGRPAADHGTSVTPAALPTQGLGDRFALVTERPTAGRSSPERTLEDAQEENRRLRLAIETAELRNRQLELAAEAAVLEARCRSARSQASPPGSQGSSRFPNGGSPATSDQASPCRFLGPIPSRRTPGGTPPGP